MTDVENSNLLILLFNYSSTVIPFPPQKAHNTHTHVCIVSSFHERGFIQIYDSHHDIKDATGK